MQYDKYVKRMQALNKFLNRLYRLRFVIIGGAVFGSIATITTLSVKGQIQVSYEFKEEYEYGEAFEPTGKALMDKVHYQYRRSDSEEWFDDRPVDAGEYVSRPYSFNGFGMRTYGEEQTFTILKKNLEISIKDTKAKYGDKLRINDNGIISGDIVSNYTYKFSDNYYTAHPFNGESSFATKVKVNESDFKITDKDGNEKTFNYNIDYLETDIAITKRPISIATRNASKEYDGKSLIHEKYDIVSSSLAEGDVINISGYNSILSPGSVNNSFSSIKISNGDYDRTDFYDVEVIEGTLTVDPISLTLKSNDINRQYDGTDVSDELEVSVIGGSILEGHRLEVIFDNPDKYINDSFGNGYTNSFEYHVYDEDDNEITTSLYNISYEYGYISISKMPLVISAESGVKKYDGTPLTNNFSCGEVASTDELELSFTGSDTITNPGTVDFSYSIVDITHNGDLPWTNYNDVYDITISGTTGSLEVEKLDVYLSKPSFTSRNYNGQKIQPQDIHYEVTGDLTELENLGYHPVVTIDPTIYDQYFIPSGYPINYTFKVVDNDGNEAPSSIVNIYDDGIPNYAYIYKAPLSVFFDDTEYIYDGKPHIAYNDPHVTGLASTDTLTYTPASYYDEPSDSALFNSIQLFISNNALGIDDTTGLYNINVKYPTMTINKRSITVDNVEIDRPYNGRALTHDEFKLNITGDGFIEGDELSVTFNQDNGTIYLTDDYGLSNSYTFNVTRNGNLFSYTDYYNIDAYASNRIYIRKKDLSITFAPKEVTYDGYSHTLYDFEDVEIDGLEGEDYISYAFPTSLPSYINYNPSPYTASYSDLAIEIESDNPLIGVDAYNCYNVICTLPELRINQRDLLIEVHNSFNGNPTIVYDGKNHDLKNTDVVATGLADHDKLISIYDMYNGTLDLSNNVLVSRLDNGYYSHYFLNNLTVINNNNGSGSNVISNYNISIVPDASSVIINQRPITLKTDSLARTYDGYNYNHNNGLGEVSVSSNSPYDFAENESLTNYTFDHEYDFMTVTDLSNSISNVVITHTDRGDVTYNYDISYDYGTINISKRPLTVTYSSLTKTYDGLTTSYGYGESDKGYVISGDLGNNDTDSPTTSSAFKYVPDSTNVFTTNIMLRHYDPYTGIYYNVTNSCYDITTVLGKIKINKRDLVIDINISLSDERDDVFELEYDGANHDMNYDDDINIHAIGGKESTSGLVSSDYVLYLIYEDENGLGNTFWSGQSIERKYYQDKGYAFIPHEASIRNLAGDEIQHSYNVIFNVANNGRTNITRRGITIKFDTSLTTSNPTSITYDSDPHNITKDDVEIFYTKDKAKDALVGGDYLYSFYNGYNYIIYDGNDVLVQRIAAGTYVFNPSNVSIYNTTGLNGLLTTNSYDIKLEYNYGNVIINIRKMNVTIDTSLTTSNPTSIVYDSNPHNILESDVTFEEGENVGIAHNDTLHYIGFHYSTDGELYTPRYFTKTGISDTIILEREDAHTYDFIYNNIYYVTGNGGVSYTSSYDINVTFTYAHVEITKRPITITHSDATFTYDGLTHSIDPDSFTLDSTTPLAENDEIDSDLILYHNFELVGEYILKGAGIGETYILKNKDFIVRKDSDVVVSHNYDITLSKVTLKINKRTILFEFVTELDVFEKDYDGNVLDNDPQYKFENILELSDTTTLADDSVVSNYEFYGGYKAKDDSDYYYPCKDYLPIYFDIQLYRVIEDEPGVSHRDYLTNQYEITFDRDLKYKINPVPVVIYNAMIEKTYDGVEITDCNILVDLRLPTDYTYSGLKVWTDNRVLDVGEYEIHYDLSEIVIKNQLGKVIEDGFFTFESEITPFVIKQAKLDYFGGLTPTLNYNGKKNTALDFIKPYFNSSSLIQGHELVDVGLFELEDVGDSFEAYLLDVIRIYDKDNNDVTSYYKLDEDYYDNKIKFEMVVADIEDPGTMSIVYYSGVGLSKDSKVEDGVTLTEERRVIPGIKKGIENINKDLFEATITYEGNFLDATEIGVYDKIIKVKVINKITGDIITHNFAINGYTLQDGYLVLETTVAIATNKITITTPSSGEHSIIYDGKEHYKDFTFSQSSGKSYDSINIGTGATTTEEISIKFIFEEDNTFKDIGNYDTCINIIVLVDGHEEIMLNPGDSYNFGHYSVSWDGQRNIHTEITRRPISIAIKAYPGIHDPTIANYLLYEGNEMYPEIIVVGNYGLAYEEHLYIGAQEWYREQSLYNQLDHINYNVNHATVDDFNLPNSIHIRKGLYGEDLNDRYIITTGFTNGVKYLNVEWED